MALTKAATALITQRVTMLRYRTLAAHFRGQITKASEAGLISPLEFSTRLEAIGYQPDFVDAYSGDVDEYLQKKAATEAEKAAEKEKALVQRLSVRAALAAYKKEEIDLVALEAAMVAAGIPLAAATAYSALAKIASAPTVSEGIKLSPAALKLQAEKLDIKAAAEEFRKGLITDVQLHARLAAAGMPSAQIPVEVAYLTALSTKAPKA